VQTSANGRAFIEKEEGVVLHLYQDEAKLWTIGCGHRVRPGEDFTAGITQAQCDDILEADLRTAEAAVDSFTNNIGQNMYDALVSLGFNIGAAAERVSTVAKMMEGGDYLAAADAFLLWNKIEDPETKKLVVSENLTERRAKERALFLLDVSTVSP
jgi:lysozyme